MHCRQVDASPGNPWQASQSTRRGRYQHYNRDITTFSSLLFGETPCIEGTWAPDSCFTGSLVIIDR